MRLRLTLPGLLLAALLALLAPAAPALARYGAVPLPADRPLNILLAGVTPKYPPSAVWPYPAAPEDFSGITDTIMLVQIRPGGEVQLLSIPRDSWVEIPGVGMSKINASNPKGGPELLTQTVSNLTGLPVDGYALLSLHAARSLTDAAGGVSVDVEKAMKYDDNAGNLHIDLQPGWQRLNGEQAEGYLRFRKDNLSDIGRIGRQQKFLTAFVDQLQSPLNWWRWPVVVGALNANSKSDLTRREVGAVLAAAMGGPTLNTHMVPGNFGSGGTWAVDQAALQQLIQTEFAGSGTANAADNGSAPAASVLNTNLAVTILNVGAPSGSAGRLAEQLRAAGLSNVTTGNGDGPGNVTTFQGEGAQQLQSQLGFGEVLAGAAPAGTDLLIRLGADLPPF
ncbi:LCP family protein [Deinococcus radiophilus]|nr:LCP family protein [Deinococcus radiophilus]UFA50816.1 LCP family protein [Deinococcus radiophilus]